MEKINKKIQNKKEQIEKTEEKLKKYKQQLKNYKEQKENKKIDDLIKTIKKEGLEINEAKELLKGTNNSIEETEENNQNDRY